MTLTIYWRVKKGWRTQTLENVTPGNVVWALQDSDRRRGNAIDRRDKARRVGSKPITELTDFDLFPIGSWMYGRCGGTCTELDHAGVCVGCLSRDKSCMFCNGTGRVDTTTEPNPLTLTAVA